MGTVTVTHKKKNSPPRLINVVAAEYVRDYILKIKFNDGKSHQVDFGKFILSARNPMTSKYKDKKLFKKFVIEDGNISWNNMEMIFPVHDLYTEKVIK